MKRITNLILTLLLTFSLLCPAAAAAGNPVLWMRSGSETGNAQLTLQGLGSQTVSSVQLELTFSGSYPKAVFAMNDLSSSQYSCCNVEEAGGRTTVTLYIDSIQSINQSGTVSLGTLSLDGSYTAPGSARLTLLDRSLESSGSSVIAVQTSTSTGSGTGSGSTSGGTNGTYSIKTSSTGRGAVMVSPGSARQGETVTVTTRPDSGYQLSELTATSGGRRLQLNDAGGGRFTFSMPAGDVEVRGTFTALVPEQKPLPFTDVREGVWYHDAVAYAYENGLMSGTSATTFGPDLSTSRGMIVTILYRLAGSPAVGSSSFTDVADGQYYAKAVAWASANGVVSGYGDGRFGPNDPITREQMAVILRGYARLNGKDVSAKANLSGYSDADSISGYARDAMGWACGEGLINGTSATTLSPRGTATRAQAAVILKGFCQNVLGRA